MIRILHNPFDMVIEAICTVQDIDADLIFVGKEQCDGNWGFAQKNTDGTFLIGVAAELPVEDALEIIAHEAAHIMAKSHEKPASEQHDAEWEMWFEVIHSQYESILERENRKEGKEV